jgi:hypothetical protein
MNTGGGGGGDPAMAESVASINRPPITVVAECFGRIRQRQSDTTAQRSLQPINLLQLIDIFIIISDFFLL